MAPINFVFLPNLNRDSWELFGLPIWSHFGNNKSVLQFYNASSSTADIINLFPCQVNVGQELLPSLLHTARCFKIKGLDNVQTPPGLLEHNVRRYQTLSLGGQSQLYLVLQSLPLNPARIKFLVLFNFLFQKHFKRRKIKKKLQNTG